MDILDFESWSIKRGVTSSTTIEKTPYAGYGLFSSRYVENDDQTALVHIPANTLLKAQNALEAVPEFSRTVKALFSEKYGSSDLDHTKGQQRLVLCLFLIYCNFFETRLQAWKPYINILPPIDYFRQHHVLFNSACIAGTNLQNSVTAKIASLKRELTEIQDLVDKEDDKQWIAKITLDMYTWAECVFWSRVVDIGDDSEEKEDMDPIMALIPYFDFANHSIDNSNIRWKRNKHNHGIDLVKHSDNAISKGQELLLCYGSKPNQELLFLHGFCIPNNPEKSRLIIPLLPFLDPANHDLNLPKIQWLKRQGAKPVLIFEPSTLFQGAELSECGWTFESIAAIYLIAMDNDDIMDFTIDDEGEEISLILSGEKLGSLEDLVAKVQTLETFVLIEARATMLLLEALEYHYAMITDSSTEQEDGSPLSQNALMYRAEEQQTIELVLERLSIVREKLLQHPKILEYLK